jgi:hypothetical protein
MHFIKITNNNLNYEHDNDNEELLMLIICFNCFLFFVFWVDIVIYIMVLILLLGKTTWARLSLFNHTLSLPSSNSSDMINNCIDNHCMFLISYNIGLPSALELLHPSFSVAARLLWEYIKYHCSISFSDWIDFLETNNYYHIVTAEAACTFILHDQSHHNTHTHKHTL